jgi:CrcB protein
MEAALLVGIGGAVGASGRYLTGVVLDAYPSSIATVTVNVIGSFVLGLLTFAAVGTDLALFFGVGVCSAYTTFSSFSFQTVDLWRRGRPGYAVLFAIGNFALAVCAVAGAWLLVG